MKLRVLSECIPRGMEKKMKWQKAKLLHVRQWFSSQFLQGYIETNFFFFFTWRKRKLLLFTHNSVGSGYMLFSNTLVSAMWMQTVSVVNSPDINCKTTCTSNGWKKIYQQNNYHKPCITITLLFFWKG